MTEYKTAQVAAITGIHPNTVRLYEEWGLISKPARRENGYRVFTELHIRQIRFARTAFQIEVLQNGLRGKIVDVVKAAARLDFAGASLLIQDYLDCLHRERTDAEEAIESVRSLLSGDAQGQELSLRRKSVSESLGVTTDALRNWEMNGLLTIKRRENGYRVYTADDIRRLKIIRALRCANYSLEAILRMLRQLSENPDIDIRDALNAPEPGEALLSACDALLVSLAAAEKNARRLIEMLQEMKAAF